VEAGSIRHAAQGSDAGRSPRNVRLEDSMDRCRRDKRIERTREALTRSFGELVLDLPYDDIHVVQVVDEAGVGRSTFYEHFRNKEDLLGEAMSGVLDALAASVQEMADGGRTRRVLEHVLQHRRAARAVLEGRPGAAIARRLADLIMPRLEPGAAPGAAPRLPARIAAEQIAESQLALLRAWLRAPHPPAPPLVAAALHDTSRALAGALTRAR
jgi:AcrR family transcriptional regulator